MMIVGTLAASQLKMVGLV